MKISELIKKAHENSCNKGFHDKPMQLGTMLMLIVSELSEALEADRNCKHGLFVKDNFEDEIADVFIRLGDLCGYLGIDIEKQIEWKMKFNESRERLHGKRY